MNNLKTLIIIPARLQASRLPNKPLLEINSIPMVIRVYQQALKSEADGVFVAGCDEKLRVLIESYNYNYVNTDASLRSGTDRIFACYKKLSLDYDVIINLQCDMPYIKPESIQKVSQLLKSDKEIDIATAATIMNSPNKKNNRSDVKVILASNNKALYFSRSAVQQPQILKHLGVYAFRPQSLEKFVSLKQSPLEKFERLEQLRALENNMNVKVVIVDDPNISIDNQEDLNKVKLL